MRKISRVLVAFVLAIAMLPVLAYAQQRTITGTVLSDDNKAPLAGVTIRVKGTQRITQTDVNGNYSIAVNPGETLQFSYVGYEPDEVKPGAGGTVAVSLKSTNASLTEVVVTAMDIKRNPRELGYSVQKVDGEEIRESQRENFLNSLQGRVAGATVTSTSGAAGASASIVLRGFNSLSMSNQPLFVIDGIIVDNTTIDENSNGGSGVGIAERGAGLTSTNNQKNDYPNRISDINPNDIETVTILKGPEATALYGSQASSGAIIITTRKAKSTKLAIQYDNSFRVQKVTRFPKTFDGYVNGTNGDSSSIFRYFGPAYGPGTVLYDNKDAFFKTGFAQTHNIGAEFGVKNSLFRVTGSVFDQDGVTPFNKYKRYNVRITNTTKFGKWVDISPSVSYIRTDNQKVLRSAGGFMLALVSWPGTNNIAASKGDNATKDPLFTANGPNAEIDNPLFNVKSNRAGETTDRYNASIGININPFSWLSLSGRFGYETYETEGFLRYHPLSYYVSVGTGGIQDNFWRKYNGYNHTITVTAKKSIAKDFNFRLMVGTMWQDYETLMYAVSGTNVVDSVVNGKMYKGGQILTDATYNALPGVKDSNATRPNTRIRLLRNVYGEYNQSLLREIAYFGEFAFNYKSVVFLNYTHRFEQASTLPKKNRNFNYPGASLSLIVSDIFPAIKSNVVNYIKLRGSVASTARLNSPYSTQSVFVNHTASGGGFSYGFFNNNAELKPEKQQTFEIGTEMRFFKSRLTFDAAYYNTLNKDQIIESFRLSYATGYVLNTQNAGGTRNKGVEVSVNAGIIKQKSLSWDMRFNFNKQTSKVIELPKNVSLYYIADGSVMNTSGGIAAGIVLGGSTTTISGNGYARNNNGDMLINQTTGLPVTDPNQKIRGDRNPDFSLGWSNNIIYKNWSLSFLWDLKVGGDIYNGTNHLLTQIGKAPLTADRMTPRVLKGVLQDGLENTATPTVNTISVIPYFNDNYYRLLPDEEFIEKDVNWFRLRDITLRYLFPTSFVKRIKPIKSLGVFVTATDVVLFTNYSGADPAVNANTAGSRGVGTFGFDYGTLPSQLAVNFGIRASF